MLGGGLISSLALIMTSQNGFLRLDQVDLIWFNFLEGHHVQLYLRVCCFLQDFSGKVKGLTVSPVDTTGAGDAFVGGLLTALVRDLNLFEVCMPNLLVFHGFIANKGS